MKWFKNTIVIFYNLLAEEKSFLSGFKKQIAMALTVTTFAVTTPAFSQESKWVSTVDTTKKTEQTLTTSKGIDQQDPSYTEKVTMPDGTAFMVSKEEYALIEKFKQAKEEGLYDTEEELWNDYKKTILRKRENKIKDQKYAEEIAKIDKRIENKKEVVTQTTKEEKTLDATIIQTKEIAAAEKESLNRELEKANQQIDEQIKKWAWRDLTSSELEILKKNREDRYQIYDRDQKILGNIQKKSSYDLSKEDYKILQTIIHTRKTYKNSWLPVLEWPSHMLADDAQKILKRKG